MAVLVEGISVIIRAERLLEAFEQDWGVFKAHVPNRTLCADGELARVGFMHPDDVGAYVAQLRARGLRHLAGNSAIDLVVADQQRGLTSQCGWAHFGHINLGNDANKRVAACMLAGSTSGQIVCPDGWTYERSLSASFAFVPMDAEGSLERIQREDGLEEFRSPLSDEPLYAGRTLLDRAKPGPSRRKGLISRWWGRG